MKFWKEGKLCDLCGRNESLWFFCSAGLTLSQCSLQETVVKEKWKLCEEKNQDPPAELGRRLFLQSKERRRSRICAHLSKLATGRRMPDRVTGAWPCKPSDGAGLLDKSGNNLLDFNLIGTTWNVRVVKISQQSTGTFLCLLWKKKHAYHSECL